MISVCIPTYYNRASLLKESIRSVLEQSFPDFELIILNDGSTDNTEETVETFQDSRIKYLENERNLGYIASINKLAQLAKADWVMFLSDDDILLPDCLQTMNKTILENENKEIGFVVPQTVNISSKGKTIFTPKLQLENKDYLVLNPKEFIFNYTLCGRKVLGQYRFNTCFPGTLFKKQIFLERGGSCPALPVAHDLFISAKICLKYPVIVIDKPLIKYRSQQDRGVSSNLSRQGEFLNEYLNYLNLLFDFIEKEDLKFDYDFKKYCFDSLVKYLFAVNGGLVKLGARFAGSYQGRLKKIREYIRFGIKQNKKLFFCPGFYISILASLLPQKLLILTAKLVKRI